MSDSSVKVGVRIRPLLSKERHQSNSLSNYDRESIEFKNQTFTYDNVFGLELSQQELYQKTAAPMLKSFLDGFNVTIMAYGQTGSGKTYTMGTADNETQDPNEQGLVPRFVCDLFENIEQYSKNEKLETHVKVSFLEIYGEDVYDLSGESTASTRESLHVRENDSGQVFVQGLHEAVVQSSAEALEYLNKGTHNRITASTNMNAGSSRSHAVFTVTLNQTVQSSQSSDDTQFISSKLTFVDLAGSERIKRTGAEGQRMKEGIQINSGLFNLGQVINGLADDQRLKNGTKASHIPYRNSKLTHLLKDALGGNSQTLFLACVSPAESNESETYSTLSYARQARNIKNKPLRNVDKTQLELRRLKYAVKTWMTKAVVQMFGESKNVDEENSIVNMSLTDLSSPVVEGKPSNSKGGPTAELFQRPEVQHYIQSINDKISSQLEGGISSSPRKLRLSIMPSPRTRTGAVESSPMKVGRKLLFSEDGSHEIQPSRRRSVEKCLAIMEGDEDSQSPLDNTEQLVSRMLEFVHKEKDDLMKPSTGGDQSPSNSTVNTSQTNFTAESEAGEEDDDSEHMAHVEREIEEKEEILNKLMDAVKGFGTMKQDYENLLHEISTLESEKTELESALEAAKKQEEMLVKSKKAPVNPLAVIKLKERFAKVQSELTKMKSDKQKKESAYRVMQRESKMCERLQDELRKMKEKKVALMRAQKAQALSTQKMKKENDLKLGQLKKNDIKKQRQMNSLKSELVKKQRVLGHKDREIGRIQSKLKACEDHITQLLNMNNKKRAQLMSTPSKSATLKRSESQGGSTGMSSSDKAHLKTSKSILDNMILDRVDRHEKKMTYDKKTKALKELREELSDEVRELEGLTAKKEQLEREQGDDSDSFDEAKRDSLRQCSQAIISTEDAIDRITHEISMYSVDVDDLGNELSQPGKDSAEDSGTWEDMGRAVISGLNQAQCQALLWDMAVEKTETLMKLESANRKYLESKDACESAAETIAELEGQVSQTKNEMKSRLEESEKQRVHDLWEVMKSASTSADEDSVAQSIAINRAQELESALQCSMEQETRLKGEISSLQKKNEELEKKSMESSFLMQSKDENQSNANELENCLKELNSAWEILGIPNAEREEVLSTISSASRVAQCNAINNTNKQIETCKGEEDMLTTGLEDMCGVLDIEESEYFNEESLKAMCLLERIANLKEAYEKVEKEMNERSRKVFVLKSKLVDVMTDMNLSSSEVCSNLQRLLRVENRTETATANKLAAHLLEKGVMISQSHISQWDSKIRDLTVEQVSNISQSAEIKKNIQTIKTELGFESCKELENFEYGIAEKDTRETILSILRNDVKVSGDVKVLRGLEKVFFALQTVRSNRLTCTGHIKKFVVGFNNYLHLSIDPHSSLTEDLAHRALQDCFLNISSHLSEHLENHVNDMQIKLVKMVSENNLSAAEYDMRLENLSTSQVSSEEEIAMLHDFDQPVVELSGLSQFIEEAWLKQSILDFETSWQKNRSQAIFAIKLSSEFNRFNIFVDALKDIKRFDGQLSRHVTDMEEFEVSSKQDRQRVLHGNSRALMEEEKFRKNGKKKFEQITEKLVQAARVAQQHSDGMQLDISNLSTQGQDLLRGKIQERIELMHLHTTTHGTKRWSGEKFLPASTSPDSLPSSDNDENVNNNQSSENRNYRARSVSNNTTGKKSRIQSRSKSPIKNKNPGDLAVSPRPRHTGKKEIESRKDNSNPFNSLLNKA